ncbi:MAG: exodeoxyribonuclease III [Gammaproteobacteria bacterium]
MKIVTWNVNSLRVRLSHLEAVIAQHAPDVICLQEIKVEDAHFPMEAIEALGYQATFAGQKSYNGVATLSRLPQTDVVSDFAEADAERRLLASTVDGIRIVNVYVPNGQSPDSDKYVYKLGWLARLKAHLQEELVKYPKLVVLGDFNIAPADIDVYDPIAWAGQVLCTDKERDALRDIMSLGLVDTFRMHQPEPGHYSWWDYRTRAFERGRGLRIDLILASEALAPKVESCVIDAMPRAWERPSDHTIVILTLS